MRVMDCHDKPWIAVPPPAPNAAAGSNPPRSVTTSQRREESFCSRLLCPLK
jgi:hypothetical protein